ncbi:hypothetical protein [Thalassotalea castellviae]|uniref:Uncharacterized protein n=1 Tax=Thalassotalea castellviae TaxID=3075612 RepID=A0ABU3A5B4_9GAMM|nr:hypothetical protein [Thalassotalea sp. W431]MDT0605365.1 hypothetical protein [Thalassotalea sp. W431]
MSTKNFADLQRMVMISNEEFLLDNPQSKTEVGLQTAMREEGFMADGVVIDQPSTSKRIVFHMHDNHPGVVGYASGYSDRASNTEMQSIELDKVSIAFIKEQMKNHF